MDLVSSVIASGTAMRIWSHLLKKSLMENFIFLCSVVRAKKVHFKELVKFVGIQLQHSSQHSRKFNYTT